MRKRGLDSGKLDRLESARERPGVLRPCAAFYRSSKSASGRALQDARASGRNCSEPIVVMEKGKSLRDENFFARQTPGSDADTFGCAMNPMMDAIRFWSFRRLERALPVSVLYQWGNLTANLHAAFHLPFRKLPPPIVFPPCFEIPAPLPASRRQRRHLYLNRALELLPDRLGTDKWIGRCEIRGLERLQRARENRKPVVLAFCHFGSYWMQRFWLRANGIPAAILIAGKAEHRPAHRRRTDRLSPFPEIPTAFYKDQMRGVLNFLSQGNPLLIALDYRAGKQIEVPVGNDCTFQMAAGAIRLAIKHDAELMSCVLIDEGEWRYRLEIGAPVPAEFLKSDSDWVRAGEHLMSELLPQYRKHPKQCPRTLIDLFKEQSAARV